MHFSLHAFRARAQGSILYLLQAVIVTAVLLAGSTARATTYYIDYTAGNDANSGVSTSSPWKHCPGDPTATGTAASTGLNPGDEVIFKGGENYVFKGTSGIALNWSGTAANPITFDGNSAGTWGTGMAVLTDNFGPNGITAFSPPNGNVNNIVFNYLKFYQIGGSNALPADPSGSAYSPNGIPPKPGYGIIAQNMTNVVIENCYFGQLGYYQGVDPIGNSSLEGMGIQTVVASGLLITNCEMTQMRDPVQLVNGDIFNTTISHCYFHDQMEWAITVLHSATSYRSNLFICNCVFSNTDQYYVGTGQGGQWTGYGEGPHENGIMMFGFETGENGEATDRAVGDTNVLIYDNYFVNSLGYPGGSTGFWFQDGTSAEVYNNVFNNCMANNDILISEPATNTPLYCVVVNNTLYGVNTPLAVAGIPGINYDWDVKTAGRKVIVENNLVSSTWDGDNNYFDYLVNDSPATFNKFTNNVYFNYNLYRSDQIEEGGLMVFGLWEQNNDFYITTNSSPSLFGWDVNSVVTTNAGFITANKVNTQLNNFALQASSPAINAGTNLTSLNLPGLNTDYAGNSRPATGNWTIGALQYNSGKGPAPGINVFAMGTNSIPTITNPGTTNSPTVIVTWSSSNATNVTLTGFGTVPLSGSTNVEPAQSITYTATAVGPGGTTSANTTVTVPVAPTNLKPSSP